METINVGKNIKSMRKKKGLTLQELAEKSGISATAISAIERNVSSPTVNTLAAIGQALGESLSSLLGESEISYVLTRSDKRTRLASEVRNADFLSLASGIPGQRFLPMLSVLKSGSSSGEDYITHRGEEFFLVVKGALDVELNGEMLKLEEGDSLYFRGNTPYRWHNASDKETHLLIVTSS